MACHFLNKSLISLNRRNFSSEVHTQNWDECYKGLDEYKSDEELAHVHLFLDYPEPLLKFAGVCTIIFMIIGVPGNIVTIVALSRYKKVRNATAIFIINLSVSDLMFTIFTFPIMIRLYLNHSWTAGKLMCRIHPILMYGFTATSLFSVVGITINRYIMVSHPSLYPKLYRKRNIIIMIINTWVSAFCFILPTIFEVWGRFSLDPRAGYCDIIPDKNGNNSKTILIIFGIIFPCFCIIGCYTRIIWIVKKSTANSKSKTHPTSSIPSDSSNRTQNISERELTTSEKSEDCENLDSGDRSSKGAIIKFKKTFKTTCRRRPRRVSLVPTKRDKRLQSMILALVLVYFTCHLPYMIAKTSYKVFDLGPYGHIIGTILLTMTVCMNPIIYVAISKEYREAYKNVFGFGCHKGN